jgi:hypothetical protein
METINEINSSKNINNEIYNLFENSIKTINGLLVVNLVVTVIVIIIVIVNSIIKGFNSYHGILIQLIILNIIFIISIQHTLNTAYYSINSMINIQSHVRQTYNIVNNSDEYV